MKIIKKTSRILTLAITSIAVSILVTAGTTLAASCYWVGTSGGNWNTAANWSSSSSGTGGTCDGGTVPSTGDTAYFDSGDTDDATVDTTTIDAAVNIQSGYTGTITVSNTGTTTFGTTFTQADGTFNGGSYPITHNNTIAISGGLYDIQTASFTSGSTIGITGGTMYAASASMDLTTAGANTLTVNGGTFSAPDNNSSNTLRMAGWLFFNAGTFNHNGGLVEFYGGSTSYLTNYADFTLHDITVNKTGTAILLINNSSSTLDGTLKLQSGVLNSSGAPAILHANGAIDWTANFSGGDAQLYISTTSDVTINHNDCMHLRLLSSQTVYTASATTCDSLNIQNGVFENSSGYDFTVNGAYTQGGGIFNAGDSNISHASTIAISDGLYDLQTASFTSPSTVTITGGVMDAETAKMDLTGTGANTITVNGGTFSAPDNNSSNTLRMAGWLYFNAGTFNANGGLVEFYGGSTSNLTNYAGSILHDITVNKTGTTVLIINNSSSTMDGNLKLLSGVLNSSGGTAILHANGTIDWTSSFSGGNAQLYVSTTSDVTINDNDCLNLRLLSSQTVLTTSSTTCDSLNIQNGVFENASGYDMTVTGTYVQNGGTFYAGDSNINHSGTIAISEGLYDLQTASFTSPTTTTITGGTMDASSGRMDLTGVSNYMLVLNGGTFSAPDNSSSNTLRMAGYLHLAAGTFNNNGGLIEFYGGSTSYLNNAIGATLEDLTINKTGTTIHYTYGGPSKVNGNIDLLGGRLYSGSAAQYLQANGTMNWTSSFSGGTGYLYLSTTADVTIYDNDCLNLRLLSSQTVFTTSSTTCDSLNIQNGVFENGDGYNLSISGAYTQSNDAVLNAGNSNITHSNTITINGGSYNLETADLTSSGNIVLNGGAFNGATGNIDLTSSAAAYNLDIYGGTFEAPGTGKLMRIRTFIRFNAGTFNHNNGEIEFYGSSYGFIRNPIGARFYDITINKSGGNYVSTDSTNNNQIDGTLYLTDGVLNGGSTSYPWSANSTISWSADFDGGAGYLAVSTTSDVTINDNDCLNLILVASQTVFTASATQCDSLYIQNGVFEHPDNRTLSIGAYTQTGGIFASTTGVDMTMGAHTQSGGTFYAGDSTVAYGTSAITINSGTYDAQTADISANQLLINNGTFDAGTANLDLNLAGNYWTFRLDGGSFTAPGSSNTFTCADSMYIETGTTFDANGGNITYDGYHQIAIQTGTGISFNDLTFDVQIPGGSLDYAVFNSNLDVNGDIAVIGGELRGSTKTLNLEGDWIMSNTGTFLGQTSTIVMDGTNQTIYGDNSSSFYNFTKSVSSPDTLYFDAGETQTFTGTLTLTGTSGNLLALKSTGYASDTPASINPTGTVNIDYVSVEDVNNVRGSDINLSANVENTDLGYNNTGWIFESPYVPPQIPEFSTYMLLLTFLIGMGMIQKKFKNADSIQQ